MTGNDHRVRNYIHRRSVDNNIIKNFFETFKQGIHIFAVKQLRRIRGQGARFYNEKIPVFCLEKTFVKFRLSAQKI